MDINEIRNKYIPLDDSGKLSFIMGRSDPKETSVFEYSEVLEDFKKAKQIRIATYNFGKSENDCPNLLSQLYSAENIEDFKIVCGIPSYRFRKPDRDVKYEKELSKWHEILNPKHFKSPVEIAFNGCNHAKLIGTENILYVGSQNISTSSCMNYEAGVIIRDPSVIRIIYSTAFESLWADSVILSTSSFQLSIQPYMILLGIQNNIDDVINHFCIDKICDDSFVEEERVYVNSEFSKVKTLLVEFNKNLKRLNAIDEIDIELKQEFSNLIETISLLLNLPIIDDIEQQIEEIEQLNIKDLLDEWMIKNKGYFYPEFYADAVTAITIEINAQIDNINNMIKQVVEKLLLCRDIIESIIDKIVNNRKKIVKQDLDRKTWYNNNDGDQQSDV